MENTLSNIRTEFAQELTRRDYPWNGFAIERIIDEWYAAKKPLIDLLSKHPNWNPKKFMIQFDTDFNRKVDTDIANNFIYAFLWHSTNIQDICTENDSWFARCLAHEIGECMTTSTYLREEKMEQIERINKLAEEFRFRPGMKVTKVMRKICEHYGWTNIMGNELNRDGEVVQYNAFEREYAKYCDAMSPLKVTRHTCISLNPLDYLLMSHGNSWRSCHYIDYFDDSPGEYSSGTISYMLDEHSIVFYTVDASYDGPNIELTEKTQRQIFGYNDYQIMQSRMYPQNNDNGAEKIYEDFRNTMQKVIADCLEKPNLWVRRKHKLNTYHGNGATCYPDWEYGDLYSTSVLKEKANVDLQAIILGAQPICIECGDYHSVEDNINCCASDTTYCEDCGCRIRDEEDQFYIDGYVYCRDCVSYCDYCDEYTREEITYVSSEDMYVCESCLSNNFFYCDRCHSYHHNDNMTHVEYTDEYVCDECLDEYYTMCDECEKYFPNDHIHCKDVDGEEFYYCDECFEEKEDENDE